MLYAAFVPLRLVLGYAHPSQRPDDSANRTQGARARQSSHNRACRQKGSKPGDHEQTTPPPPQTNPPPPSHPNPPPATAPDVAPAAAPSGAFVLFSSAKSLVPALSGNSAEI